MALCCGNTLCGKLDGAGPGAGASGAIIGAGLCRCGTATWVRGGVVGNGELPVRVCASGSIRGGETSDPDAKAPVATGGDSVLPSFAGTMDAVGGTEDEGDTDGEGNQTFVAPSLCAGTATFCGGGLLNSEAAFCSEEMPEKIASLAVWGVLVPTWGAVTGREGSGLPSDVACDARKGESTGAAASISIAASEPKGSETDKGAAEVVGISDLFGSDDANGISVAGEPTTAILPVASDRSKLTSCV